MFMYARIVKTQNIKIAKDKKLEKKGIIMIIS